MTTVGSKRNPMRVSRKTYSALVSSVYHYIRFDSSTSLVALVRIGEHHSRWVRRDDTNTEHPDRELVHVLNPDYRVSVKIVNPVWSSNPALNNPNHPSMRRND